MCIWWGKPIALSSPQIRFLCWLLGGEAFHVTFFAFHGLEKLGNVPFPTFSVTFPRGNEAFPLVCARQRTFSLSFPGFPEAFSTFRVS